MAQQCGAQSWFAMGDWGEVQARIYIGNAYENRALTQLTYALPVGAFTVFAFYLYHLLYASTHTVPSDLSSKIHTRCSTSFQCLQARGAWVFVAQRQYSPSSVQNSRSKSLLLPPCSENVPVELAEPPTLKTVKIRHRTHVVFIKTS